MSEAQAMVEVSVGAESRGEGARAVSLRPVYSMTGYASAQAATEDGLAFSLAMKSVNHRFLDLNMRLPSDCDALEVRLRRAMKESVRRGHVDVTLHVDRRGREAGQTVQLNHELLSAHMRAFHEAAKAHHFNVEPDLNELLRMPGVVSTEMGAVSMDATRIAALETAVMALAPSLLEQLNQVRAVEGAALAAELRGAMLRLRGLAEECALLRSGAREAHFERLRVRIGELLRVDAGSGEGGAGSAGVSEQRLLAEAALLVERSDIEEELVRLRAHIESFVEMLDGGGELGKRLDFSVAGAEPRGEYGVVEDEWGRSGDWAAADFAGAGDEGGDRAGAGAGAESGVGRRVTLLGTHGWDFVYHFGAFGVREVDAGVAGAVAGGGAGVFGLVYDARAAGLGDGWAGVPLHDARDV
jgi:uncharacterized protein (TIGR00255 family)